MPKSSRELCVTWLRTWRVSRQQDTKRLRCIRVHMLAAGWGASDCGIAGEAGVVA